MDQKRLEKDGRGQADESLALMYPTNQLGEQVRAYDETSGVGALLKHEFFDKE